MMFGIMGFGLLLCIGCLGWVRRKRGRRRMRMGLLGRERSDRRMLDDLRNKWEKLWTWVVFDRRLYDFLNCFLSVGAFGTQWLRDRLPLD